MGNDDLIKHMYPSNTFFAEYLPLQVRAEVLQQELNFESGVEGPVESASDSSIGESQKSPSLKERFKKKKEKKEKEKGKGSLRGRKNRKQDKGSEEKDSKEKDSKEKDSKEKDRKEKDSKEKDSKEKDSKEKESNEREEDMENDQSFNSENGPVPLTDQPYKWKPSEKQRMKKVVLKTSDEDGGGGLGEEDNEEGEHSPRESTLIGGSKITASRKKLEKKNQIYLLEVHIQSAEDLPCVDKNGSTNPYCVATLSGRQQTTTKLKKTRSPEWGQTLAFQVVKDYSWKGVKLKLELFHSTFLGKDLPLGELEVVLEELDFEKQHKYQFKVSPFAST